MVTGGPWKIIAAHTSARNSSRCSLPLYFNYEPNNECMCIWNLMIELLFTRFTRSQRKMPFLLFENIS
jgi:hypothetical protein